jgi:TRAP transporter TAXI family solute receptor
MTSLRHRQLLLIFTALFLSFTLGCDAIKGLTGKKGGGDADESSGSDGPSILTGSKKGNYYKAAVELNEILGDDLAFAVKATKGSYGNLQELGRGEADYAIVQFDTLIMFLRMGGDNKKWANNALAMAPLSLEHVHIIVSKKAKIRSLEDLKGKRIAAGSERSGSFVSAFTLMIYFNDFNLQKYDKTSDASYDDALEALQKGKLDALFITTAPGMPLLEELDEDASETIELLDVGKNMKLPKGIDFTYAPTPLKKGTYPWQKKTIHQLATPSYLFAHHKLSSSKTRKIAKKIYGGAKKLRKKSGLWKLVSKKRAKQDMKFGIGFHPGVKAYFATGK